MPVYKYTIVVEVSCDNIDTVKEKFNSAINRVLDNATFVTEKEELLLTSKIEEFNK